MQRAGPWIAAFYLFQSESGFAKMYCSHPSLLHFLLEIYIIARPVLLREERVDIALVATNL